MRSALIVIAVLAFVLVSCATIPTPQQANDALVALRRHGSWGWALGVALIWADLLLPIPQTAVIAALGIIYGTLLGGLLGNLGLITGGLLGRAPASQIVLDAIPVVLLSSNSADFTLEFAIAVTSSIVAGRTRAVPAIENLRP